MRFQSVRQAAREYALRSFRPIPLYGVDELGDCRCGNPLCKPRDAGKHEPEATEGVWKEGGTFSPEDFRETDNIALAMGPYKLDLWLVALDVDGADDLEPFFPGLPITLRQKTPRGAHFLFVVPEFTPLGNWTDVFDTRRAGFQLDVRYARGRIVVAPSKGATGPYEWTCWRPPAALPMSCVEAILAQRRERGLKVQDAWERGGKAP